MSAISSNDGQAVKRPLEDGENPPAKKIELLQSELKDLRGGSSLILSELVAIRSVFLQFHLRYHELQNTLSDYRESFRQTLLNTIAHDRVRHFGGCDYIAQLDDLRGRIEDLAGDILDQNRNELLEELQVLVAEPEHQCEVSTPTVSSLSW